LNSVKVIAEWIRKHNFRARFLLIGGCLVALALAWKPLFIRYTLLRLHHSIILSNWSDTTTQLQALWCIHENRLERPSWFQRALDDLTALGGASVDTYAQSQLINWLNSIGASRGARLFLDREMVLISNGEFLMGSDEGQPDEAPSRTIRLSTYFIDRFEVTHLQYREYVISEGIQPPSYWTGTEFPVGLDLTPVVGISWDQAQGYCEWLDKRLPTEAEWENACRGNDGRLYPWGNEWDASLANVGLSWRADWPDYFDNAWVLLQDSQSAPLTTVGAYPDSNSLFGVADMIGNASEWVYDWYDPEAYQNLPTIDPVAETPPWNHSVRGFGWFTRKGWNSVVEMQSRCSARSSSHSFDDPRIGFRCTRLADG
jgi:formylglycine-generating enzyme required for sulfatase activity